MFERRPLSPAVEATRTEYAPDAIVLECERDFELLPTERAEGLGGYVDRLEPTSYPASWLPSDAPQVLVRHGSTEFTVGLPGDGSVAWTRQTEPPVVLVKPRIEGSPASFVDFLLAEALVELDCDLPESFLPFFEEGYRELDAVIPLDANSTYQIAVALYDGWCGLQTREAFAAWKSPHPDLWEAWYDAGARLENRVQSLPREIARGNTNFADATELACSAIKHAIELPAPFTALDTQRFREHGPPYAIRWAEKTFEALQE